ncbi:hypothetical protein K9M09_02470 [Patescibacteria group bacterium]|nr:hypothetical protein [Patescibacteria group bacterium]
MSSKILKLLLYILPVLAFWLLSVFLLKNSFSYSDLDLGWHLRAGQDIISNWSVSSVNNYNYTLVNQPWVDHEWLLNLVMAKIYNNFTSLGLHLIFLLVILLAFYLAWRRAYKFLGKSLFNRYLSFIFLFIGLWASQPHLGIRVQEFGLLGLIILLSIIDNYPKNKKVIYYIPLLFLLWANVHASFILGLALLSAYSCYLYVSPFLIKIKFLRNFSLSLLKIKDKNRILVVLLLSVVASLINPYGATLYGFLSGYSNTFYMPYISEWQGQHSLPWHYPQLIYLSLSATGALLWFWFERQQLMKIKLWDLGLFLLFFILAWRSRRHFPLFVFISLPLVILFYQEIFKSFWQSFSVQIKVILLSFLTISIFFSFLFILIYLPLKQKVIDDFCNIQYPCMAAEYLKNHPETERSRMFSEYNWGGYLLWAYPEKQIFIDGRMPQVAYKEHSILEEYLEFRKSKENAEKMLNEHQVDLVLIKKNQKVLSLNSCLQILLNVKDEELVRTDHLKEYLLSSKEWRLIFQDDLSVMFARQ